MSEKLDDFKYRMGIADKPSYWDQKIRREASFTTPKPRSQRRTIAEQSNPNPMVVQQGIMGSVQEVLGSFLRMVMEQMVEEVPGQYKRTNVRIQQPSSLLVAAHMEGTSIDVVPTRVELRLEMDPRTLRDITCTVAIDDGVYDPRDFRNDIETFTVDWTSPMQDLIGFVVRYLNSRRRGIGPRG